MAKEVQKVLKLQIRGGAANPSPPVGPALGAAGVNIMEFCKQFNARTQDKPGKVVPVVISVFADKSFEFVIKTPPAAAQLLEAAKVKKGSGEPNRIKVASVSWDQIRKIAEDKMVDLNAFTVESAMKMVAGTARSMGLNVKGVDASNQFLSALAGIDEPEAKRKAIGRVFIEVFDQEAHLIEDVTWLAQGTIYPDIIESISVNGPSATIKSHHNVGGLPDFMKLKVVEPLKTLFKDEVRRVGASMDMAADLLGRHPFPGPGLAIRILGDITAEKVAILQEVDYIFIQGLKDEGLYDKVWQAGSILLPVNSVGVMGDERTYEKVVALRAVESTDGMTADWVHLPYEFLAKVSNQIINKVKGVNRVVYDISSKPPATIEWE